MEPRTDEEIATLLEQITAAEAELARRRAEKAELGDLTEALSSMSLRLSRLLSCKRIPT